MYTPKTTIPNTSNKNDQKNFRFKMAAKKTISLFRKNGHVTKSWKQLFNNIWLKVEEHEYIPIFGIKFRKNILLKSGGQSKFYDIVQ